MAGDNQDLPDTIVTDGPSTTSAVDADNILEIRGSLASICRCDNPEDCWSLETIMDTINTCLDEETAWALLHQILVLLRSFGRGKSGFGSFEVPEKMTNIHLHRDGLIHWSWSDEDIEAISKKNPGEIDEKECLQKVGCLLYATLDYTLKLEEERTLTQGLQDMLEFLCFGKVPCEKSLKAFSSSELPLFDFALDKCRKRVVFTLPETHYMSMCVSLYRDAYTIGQKSDSLDMSSDEDAGGVVFDLKDLFDLNGTKAEQEPDVQVEDFNKSQ